MLNSFINFFRSRISNLNSYSVIIGIKKGYNLETLPHNVRTFIDKPWIRILRVIGGLFTLLSILIKYGHIDYNFTTFSLYIINTIALLQLTQIVVIGFIKLVFGIKKLINNKEEFEVRNSPLNKIATLTTHLVYCWKIGCQVGSSGIGLLSAAVLIDGVLDASNQEKIFEPLLKKGVTALVGTESVDAGYNSLMKKFPQLESDSNAHIELQEKVSRGKDVIDKWVRDGIITKKEGDEMKEGLDLLEQTNFRDLKVKSAGLVEEHRALFKRRFEEENGEIKKKKT